MIITILLMAIVVAAIVVLPYFTETAPGSEMARQRQEAIADQLPKAPNGQPSESAQSSGVGQWLEQLL